MVNEFESYYNEFYTSFKKQQEVKEQEELEKERMKFDWKDSLEYKCLFNVGYKKNLETILNKELLELKSYIVNKEKNLEIKKSISSLLIKNNEEVNVSKIEDMQKALNEAIDELLIKDECLSNAYNITLNICEELNNQAIDEGIVRAENDSKDIIEKMYLLVDNGYSKILSQFEKAILDFKYDNSIIESIVQDYDNVILAIKISVNEIINLSKINYENVKSQLDTINKLCM